MAKKNKRKVTFGKMQVITLCISTAMVLVLLGLVVLSVFTASNLSSYMKENFTVSLMLTDDLSDQEAKAVCQELQKRPYVSNLTFISKEQALKENTEELGVDPTEFAEENPFPSTVEMQLLADYANSDSLAWIEKELTANNRISDVSFPKDLMDQVNNTLQKISGVLLVLAALLTFISFSLINNTVQLSIFARRFSIHTMKLVGASWNFIRWPFLKLALQEGLIAAIIADLVLAALFGVLVQWEPDIFSVITVESLVITGVSVLLFGLLITTVCSYFSVNKYLRMTAGDLYKI